MAPLQSLADVKSHLFTERNFQLVRRAAVAGTVDLATRSPHLLASRGLHVAGAQKVTLALIGVYVVVIAILWNVPILRWSLWPFKVRSSMRLLNLEK
jgi:hypothetical protein